MVNDDNGILAGLYRECDLVEKIEESSYSLKKNMKFGEETFVLIEQLVEKQLIWKIYNSKGEQLSREDVVNLYAIANLRRQMKTRF